MTDEKKDMLTIELVISIEAQYNVTGYVHVIVHQGNVRRAYFMRIASVPSAKKD